MTQPHALALTLAIELSVAIVILRATGWRRGAAARRTWLVVLAASLITHPLAWHANRSWLSALRFGERAAIIEAAVVLVEAAIVWRATAGGPDDPPRLAWRRSVVLSLLMNAASFGYGLWRLG